VTFVSYLRDWLRDPRLEGVDVDTEELLEVHWKILEEKRLMREVVTDYYRNFLELDREYLRGSGKRIELGAGTSMFKKLDPEVIVTDIKPDPRLDQVMDAVNTGLPDGSVRTFYGINCFHHFPDPNEFFREANRVLVPGGGIVLIEPYYGPLSSFLHQRMHKHEHFNRDQVEWINPDVEMKAMTGANQALAWMMFIRDYELFRSLHPTFSMVRTKRLRSSLRYLLAGGLNFRSLVPQWSEPGLRVLEKLLSPLDHVLTLHYALVIQKDAR